MDGNDRGEKHAMSTPPLRLNAPPETLDDDPPLRALMSVRLVGITPDASVRTALLLLASAGVRHLPVLAGANCIGLVTEHDVVRCVADVGLTAASATVAVSQLCRLVPLLGPDQRRSAAALDMQTADVDAVLVVDAGKLVGIVTATDVIRSLASNRGLREANDPHRDASSAVTSKS